MKKSPVSRTQRFTYFQILYCVLERWTRTLNQILHGKTDWHGSKVHQNTELWTELMVSQWNSSGIFSQDSPHCSSATKSKSSCLEWATHQNSKDANYLHVNVQWHNMVNYRQWTGMHCWCHTCDYIYKEIPSRKMVTLPDLDQKRSGFFVFIDRPQGEWDRVAESMLIRFGESGHPEFSEPRVRFPRGTLKSKGGWKLSIHFCADGERLKLFFA